MKRKKTYSWIYSFFVMNLIIIAYVFNRLIPKMAPGLNGTVIFLVLLLLSIIFSTLIMVIYYKITGKPKIAWTLLVTGIIAAIINAVAFTLVMYSLIINL